MGMTGARTPRAYPSCSMDAADRALCDLIQNEFPVVERPYAAIGDRLDMSEDEVLERVQRLRGETYEPHEVWVIGDTPNDLACARIANVRCLLVGTGGPGWDGVRALGADHAVPDLSDVDAVFEVLTGS